MRRSPSNFREVGWVALYPLAWAWAAVVALRRKLSRNAYRSALPVVCVGNLHSGGSGKTPLVSAIAEHFSSHSPVILSRGYGGRLSRFGAVVDVSAVDGPARFGDEPWMLARRHSVPVYVSADRARGARAIEKDRAGSFVILDDGFQHLGLARTTNLIVVNGLRSPSDGNCIPLGDLREPWSALSAADAVVLVRSPNDQGENWKAFLAGAFPHLVVFEATKVVEGLFEKGSPHSVVPSARYAAFCALARPEAFFADADTLVKPRFTESFPDHHAYSASEVDRLAARGRAEHIDFFVTTEKDLPKVDPLAKPLSARLLTLRIRYEMSGGFWYFLENRLAFPTGV